MPAQARLPLSVIRFVALTVAAAMAMASCAQRSASIRPDPGVVEAHTAGVIPRGESVKVVFVRPMKAELDRNGMSSLISFFPALKGKAAWLDERTLEFTPASPMRGGQAYRASVDYGILQGKSAGTERFTFDFLAQEPAFGVSVDPVSVDGAGKAELSGLILTAKEEDGKAVEGLLKLPAGISALPVQWKHDPGAHRFSVSGISQGTQDRVLTVSWDGRAIGSGLKGKASARVPGSKSFNVLSVRGSDPGQNFIELAFSRALDRDQDLRGIVSVDSVTDLRYSIDRNKLKLYPASFALPQSATVRVGSGVKDSSGGALALPVVATVRASQQLPQVRFLGSGVIVPTSQGFTVPIETMNLSGVIVEAFKINGSSIPQFLQVNELDGKRELKRVGKSAWSKSFELNWNPSQRDTWVRHGLDLSELIKKNPDGMFQIRVTFRKRHIEYVCPNDHPDFSGLHFPDDSIVDRDEDGESSYWDYWEGSGNYSWDSPYNYYNNRNDPCHPAFYLDAYGNDRVARRNVLISNIGLMAKREASGGLTLYASDLRSAKPMEGVSLELLDYQRQKLASAATDKNGMAVFASASGLVSLATAQASGQMGYLKLDDKLALATSHFDVDGDKSEQGVKGFIYGERGVWRPGDPIYLTFILQDAAKAIPENHPVLFALENPRGQVTSRETYTKGLNGFYAIKAQTQADAPTGDWIARVTVGNKSYTKSLKIETVMPNRLKINLDFGKSGYLSADRQSMSLSSAWLHGAPAPGLKADVSVVFTPSVTAFPGYADYVFDDPTRTVSGERQTLFEGALDKDSKADFSVQISAGENPPGKLKANILSRVYEPSGVFSSEQFQADFHPYDRYVGIKTPKGDEARGMLLTDKDHVLDIAMLDKDGKGVPSATVECSVAKIQWRWWWEKGAENLAEYQNSEYFKVLQTTSAQVRNGKGKWTFQVKYPEWGRYLITARDTAGGHSAAKIVYIDWPGWAGRGGNDSGSASMLSLTVPKASYSVGEKVSVSFPSNGSGAALVAIEKAGRILRQSWVKTGPETTSYEFEATSEMSPNVYVHVTFLQPHLQTANDLPIRLYGIAPVMVEDPQSHLKPALSIPAQLKPLSKAEFSVREENGRPMTYTVAVVDEGLLGLTRFSAPDPWSTFYKKEASVLKSWDLYQYVSGAFSGKLETLLSIGGSDDSLSGADRKANRFKAVAMYLGPFSLAKGETRTHSIDIPEYVGSLRFMVVAGSGAAYGVAEKAAPVKSDLMVLGTLPRVLSPGEELSLPVSVFCYMDGKRSVKVDVKAEGAASLADKASANVDFAQPGDQVAKFKVKAANRPGLAKFRITAASGSAVASTEIELDVRSTSLPVSVSQAGTIDGKAKKELVLEMRSLPGLPGTNDLTLELSRLPPLNLASRMEWLIAYPHGCVEQTTSSVFPQLYLDKVIDLSDERKAAISRNVDAGIERLKSFQTPEGGFAYWPGEEDSNAWGSNYAGHFLLEARRAGYDVPQELLSDWVAFQEKRAQAFSGETEEALSTQAYRLYTLALAKEADMASMNRLREREKLPLAVSWRLAAAYWMAGERETARGMVKGLGYGLNRYRELSGTFGSDTRDLAMVLETLGLLGDSTRAGAVMKSLAEKIGSGNWMSTQELAYSLIAILPYAGAGPRSTIQYSYQLSLGNSGNGPKVRGDFDSGIVQIPLGGADASSAAVSLSTDSTTVLFARLIARGIPPMGSEVGVSQGLSLSVNYATMDGSAVSPDLAGLGSDMELLVTVGNEYPSDLKGLALSHIIPSGWEILNYRIAMQDKAQPVAAEGDSGDAEGSDSSDESDASPPPAVSAYPFMDYQDIRDDRVYTYFSLAVGETKTFVVRVNKTYEGTFYLPAVSVSAMYDDSIQAVVPGRWLKSTAAASAPAQAPFKHLMTNKPTD